MSLRSTAIVFLLCVITILLKVQYTPFQEKPKPAVRNRDDTDNDREQLSVKSKSYTTKTVSAGYAYHAVNRWWFSDEVTRFHQQVRDAAETLLQNVSHSAFSQCSSLVDRTVKNEYQQRGNLHMSHVTKAEASAFVSFGEPLHNVVNPEPVQLNNSFDLSKKFGKWRVTFSRGMHHSSVEPAMSVAFFQHAILSHGHVISCAGNMFSAGGCLFKGQGHVNLSSVASKPDKVENIIAVAMPSGARTNYYHFSHEHLPLLALVYDLLMQNHYVRLVLSHPPVSFAKQFYTDILGIPKEKILVAGGNGIKAGVAALPTPMLCGSAFTSALVGLRRLVLAKVGVKVKREDLEDVEDHEFHATDTRYASKIRVLLAERSHLSRMPRNWEELKKFLKQEFASVAEFEETQGREHVREQVLRFYRADVVIGPHGANLANIMFMRPGRHVLEMASFELGQMCFYSTATKLNLTHHLVLHDKGKDSHYWMTKEILRDHLRYAVDRVKNLPP